MGILPGVAGGNRRSRARGLAGLGGTRSKKAHKDVDFVVRAHGRERYLGKFYEAAADAMYQLLSGADVTIDVLIHSEAGARWYGGDVAVAAYKEDPDASVFERYEIRGAHLIGRVA